MANEYGNYANILAVAAREQTNFNPDSQSWTYTNGNLTFEHTASGGDAMFPFSQPMQPGSKYHFEFTTNSFHSSVYARFAFFLMPVIEYQKTSNPIVNTNSKTFQVSLIRSGGTGANEAKFNNSAITTPTNKPTTGSRVTIEVDMSTVGSTTVRYYFNGSLDTTWSSLAFTDTPYYVGIFTGTETDRNGVHSVNFGQTAFSDTVTADHIRLNTASMSTPAVVNYEDEYYVQAGISHSNGSTTAVTLPKTVSGGAMARIKRTDSDAGTSDWIMFDTVRGVNKSRNWNDAAAEDTSTYDDQNLTGTTLTMPSDLTTGTYMIECFYVGSYFQIQTVTGNAGARTITWPTAMDSYGFSAFFPRTGASSGIAHHIGIGAQQILFCDNASAAANRTNFSQAPNKTDFRTPASVGPDFNLDTIPYVCYGWANSGPYAFGSYEGNGDANGLIIDTGFFPNTVVTKSIDSTSGWQLYSAKATTSNPRAYLSLQATADLSNLNEPFDIYSNGFKSFVAFDPNVAETYIYMAFGDRPMTDGGVNQGRAK